MSDSNYNKPLLGTTTPREKKPSGCAPLIAAISLCVLASISAVPAVVAPVWMGKTLLGQDSYNSVDALKDGGWIMGMSCFPGILFAMCGAGNDCKGSAAGLAIGYLLGNIMFCALGKFAVSNKQVAADYALGLVGGLATTAVITAGATYCFFAAGCSGELQKPNATVEDIESQGKASSTTEAAESLPTSG